MTQLYIGVDTAEDGCIVIQSVLKASQWENIPEVRTASSQHLNCYFKIFDDRSLAQQLFKPTVLMYFSLDASSQILFSCKKKGGGGISSGTKLVSYLIRNV